MTTRAEARAHRLPDSHPRRRLFTADEYEEMVLAGILKEDDRVELWDGEIFEMPAIGDWHNGTVDILNWRFGTYLGGRAILRVQGSFRLNPMSEPEPDIAVLRFREDFYRTTKVGPGDVLLVIEVSDTTLAYDRDFKLPRYARAGIPEVWIVVKQQAHIEVHRDPAGETYRTRTIHPRGTSVSPLAFPDISIAVEEIIG
jgi:Uma2 family endonuclease